jgi:hypothetical protein
VVSAFVPLQQLASNDDLSWNGYLVGGGCPHGHFWAQMVYWAKYWVIVAGVEAIQELVCMLTPVNYRVDSLHVLELIGWVWINTMPDESHVATVTFIA